MSILLKVMDYKGDVHRGFTLYEGERVDVHMDEVTVHTSQGVVHIDKESHLRFYVLNQHGDTIDSFRGDYLQPRQAPQQHPHVTTVYGIDGRAVWVGRQVQDDGAIATTLLVNEGEGPVLLQSREVGQLAAALLQGPYSPDTTPPCSKEDRDLKIALAQDRRLT